MTASVKKKIRILNDDTPASAGAEPGSQASPPRPRGLLPVAVKGIPEPVRVVTLGGKA